MRREIKYYRWNIARDIRLSKMFGNSFEGWFSTKVNQQKLGNWLKTRDKILLAHADDGVIWGKEENDTLVTSHTIVPEFSPKLRAETLQQCRLFNVEGELLIWRDETGFRARLIQDKEVPKQEGEVEAFDEEQMLWGTYRDAICSRDGFTVVYEGQGLHHAVPLSPNILTEECFGKEREEHKRKRPLRLTVRHYVEYDKNGFARITLSRLVKLYHI